MIKNIEVLGIIVLLHNFYVVSQGYQSPDAPKQPRTPQNTGCLNYGHSCLGAHGKRSRLLMPKFFIPQFMSNWDSTPYASEESDGSSSGPEVGPYANGRSAVGRPNSYGFFPYNLLSSAYIYKPNSKSYPAQEDGYKTFDAIEYMKKNYPENIATSLNEWAKLLIANMDPNALKDHQRLSRQVRIENYDELKDKKISTDKGKEKQELKIQTIPRVWLKEVN